MANIIETKTGKPQIAEGVFLAPTSTVVGQVKIKTGASLWFNTVVRGDVMPIVIGENTNIQDGTVVHGTYQKCGTQLGDNVSVGHSVILHGCRVEDNCLIGMGSILMDQVKISKNTIVGAGSLVTENSEFPEGVLVLGRPAKVVRELKPEEIAFLAQSAKNYLYYQTWYDQNSQKQTGELDG